MPKLSEVVDEYIGLFRSCIISPGREAEVESLVNAISRSQTRYQVLSDATRVPWFVIAVLHNMECGLNFEAHLHNGDSLKMRTVNVPAGRPTVGDPPFKFEDSARDALTFDGLAAWKDWSVAGICYRLEAFNGWGYRSHQTPTPYLWSGSLHYKKGKFVSDGVWSNTAVSRQIGAAVILRRMAEKGLVSFDGERPPALVVVWTNKLPTDPKSAQLARSLQTWLNTQEGIFLTVDGITGDKTSDAFKAVTGRYLLGDRRGTS